VAAAMALTFMYCLAGAPCPCPPLHPPLQIVKAMKDQADRIALTSRAFYNGMLALCPASRT
jgi:hypothetical protein